MAWQYIIPAAVSLASSYFSNEAAKRERQRRIDRMRQVIGERRQSQLAELETERRRGYEDLGTYTEGLRSNEATRAERLARSLGRSEEAESYRLPGTQAVSAAGTRAMRGFLGDVDRSRRDIGRYWDDRLFDVESDVAGEPIDTNAWDYLGLASEYAPGIYNAFTRDKTTRIGSEGFIDDRHLQRDVDFAKRYQLREGSEFDRRNKDILRRRIF